MSKFEPFTFKKLLLFFIKIHQRNYNRIGKKKYHYKHCHIITFSYLQI
nr:MAG TPA: hypothetical protein [Caudoviricetes sp.]